MSTVSVSLSGSTADLPLLSDAEFLQAIRWEAGADPALRAAAELGDVSAFRAAWQARLRTKPIGNESALGFGARALWSKAAFPEEADLAQLLAEAAGAPAKPRVGQRRSANKATRSLAQRAEVLVYSLTEDRRATLVPASAFALVAALELISRAGTRLRPQQLWRLWRHSLSQVIRLVNDASSDVDPTIPADVQLVERGELPFIAGLLFDGVVGAAQLVKTGRKFLARELVDRTDTDGTPHAELVERLPLWLAPLIRATKTARRFNTRLWTDNQEELLKSVVERSIPLCRPDGRAVLSNGLKLEPLPVLVAAAEVCGLPELDAAGSYLHSVKRVASGKPPRRTRNDGVVLMPSNQSDFARLALLRSDWSIKADTVALAHHRKFPQLDVTAAGRSLIHGDWELELNIGGTPVELADEWSCVCWQSDPDADYIELQMIGPGRLRVERMVMLSRTQQFLLLADSISGVPHERIEYQSKLSLGDGVQSRADTQTREVQLTMKGLRPRVFPLALPQDRVLSTPHEFLAGDSRLTLKQTADGEGLFAPLLFDWNPGHARGDVQWRTLTVTEDSHVVGNDVASGHRLKIADLQLLVYRSLKKPGQSRAVLGHHTPNETVIGRVDKKGDVDPILMVEPS